MSKKQDQLVDEMIEDIGRVSVKVSEPNDIVDKYTGRMKVYRDFREQNFDKHWDENYNMYLSNYTTDLHTSPTRSKLFIPMSFWCVENWMTKVAAAFFSGDRVWEVVPRFKKTKDIIRPTQYLLDYQTDIYDWEQLLMDILKSTGMYGLSWTFFGWDLKIKTREVEIEEPIIKKNDYVRDPVTGEVKTRRKTIKEPFIDQDRPVAMLVPPKEVYWDPKGTTVENCLSIVREYYQDYDAVEKKKKEGTYNKPFSLKNLGDLSNQELEKDRHKQVAGINEPQKDARRKRVKTWDIYEDGYWYTVLNETMWVREKANPLPRKEKPIMLLKDICLPNELRALSEIDPIKNINIERNTIRNQRIDQVSLDINKMFLVDKNAIIDKNQFYSAPNHYIEVQPIAGSIQNSIIPLNSPSVPMSSYTEESMLDNDAQQASGQLDYAVGNTPQRREAARTIRSLQTVAFQRFDVTKVKPLMFQLKKFPKMILMFDKTYLTGDSIDVRIYNKSSGEYTWENVTLEDIDIECDFRYPGSLGKSMKIERREELRTMIEMCMGYQQNLMSMGGAPIFDFSVPVRYWLKEGEWGELADEMIIQPHQTTAPISPQTLQKDLQAQDKMALEQMRMNPEAEQAKQQQEMEMEKQGAEDESVARKQKMSEEMEAHQGKMAREQDKHEREMQHKQEMHELEMKLKASQKNEK